MRPTAGVMVREAAILAGGSSRRMGKDKALVEVDGRTMIERAFERLAGRFERFLVSVEHEGPSESMEKVAARIRSRGLSLEIVPDLRPGRLGPLAGIESILKALESSGVFVVAVDVPLLHLGLIDSLCRLVETEDRLGVVPVWRGGVEPLHAVYRDLLLPVLSRMLDAGERRARSLADQRGVALLEVWSGSEPSRAEASAVVESFDSEIPPGEIFRNLNTPAAIEDYFGRRDGTDPAR